MERAFGYDSSKYDKFLKPDENSIVPDFLILRTGYGMMEDGIFVQSSQNVRYGLPIGTIKMVYHYMSSGVPWREQIDRHLEICAKGAWEPAMHWIDFETAYNEMSDKFASETVQAIQYLWSMNKKAGLYTRMSLYPYIIRASVDHNKIPFWYAWPIDHWGSMPNMNIQEPKLPDGRDAWGIWQYSWQGNGTAYGAGRDYAFDLDVYDGTLEKMREQLGLGIPEPPEPPDEWTYDQGFKDGYSNALHDVIDWASYKVVNE